MHGVPLGRLFERQRDAQRRGFVVQAAGEHDCARQARRTREAAGNANRRVAGQVSNDQTRALGCW